MTYAREVIMISLGPSIDYSRQINESTLPTVKVHHVMSAKLKTASNVINIKPINRPPRPEVVVLPWLEIPGPIRVGRIHFLSLPEASDRLGPILGARLNELTADLKDVHGRGVIPTIAMRDGKPRIARGHIKPPGPIMGAIEKLSFVATLSNCLCQGKVSGNANATTFHFFYQGLGGPPGTGAYTVSRRYGQILGGGVASAWETVRPLHCGKFDALDELKRVVLDALVKCKDVYVAKSLHLFYEASKDSGDHEAALVLFDAAFEALLGAPSKTNTKARTLLSPFDSCLKQFVKKNLWGGILGAIWMLRDRRNLVVHPHISQKPVWRLPRRKNVPLMAIYERCYIAQMLAYLVNLKRLNLSIDVSSVVTGTEVWLRDPNDDYCRLLNSYVKWNMVKREITNAWRANKPKT